MQNNENRKYIFRGLIILLIIFGITRYVFVIRPEQIKAKCTAEFAKKEQIYVQNLEFSIEQSRIERKQHQEYFVSLSEAQKKEPINIGLMKKWDNNNIEVYEKTLREREKENQEFKFKECIKRGGV